MFIVEPGTSINPRVDRYPTAESALDAALALLSQGRPNVRVFANNGQPMKLDHLWRAAGRAHVLAGRRKKRRSTFE